MSTTGAPQEDAPAASDVATRLREAGFVRLVAAGTGDGVAAAGLLVAALDRQGVAYQTSVVALPDPTARATGADLTVAVGRPVADADLTLGTDGTPASRAALAVVREFQDAVDTRAGVLALAGVIAAGGDADGAVLAAADTERRPGVAVPVSDPIEGLAHSTLVHAPFSGSVAETRERLGEFDSGRALASAVALAVAGDDAGTARGAAAVERVLRPQLGGPFGTVGGYADVLDALARERPGHAVAAALGADVELLPVWRDHAKRAHGAVRAARTGRYEGLFVARCEGSAPVGTVARLVRDYRSPEPVVLVVADGTAAMLATPEASVDVGRAVEAAARAADGDGTGTPTRGRARFDGESSAFVPEAREAV